MSGLRRVRGGGCIERSDLLMGTLVSQRLYGARARLFGRESGYGWCRVVEFGHAQVSGRVSAFDWVPGFGRARRAAAAVSREIARLERLWSAFRPDSEIRRIGQAAGRVPVAVHPDTHTLLSRAKELSLLCGGRFDVTAGPLTRLWRDASGEGAPPPPKRIEELMHLVDRRSPVLENDDGIATAFLPQTGQEIDVGGIGKGFAADRAAELYRRFGIRHAFINLGGNVLTVGCRPDGSPWRVGIRHPPGLEGSCNGPKAELFGGASGGSPPEGGSAPEGDINEGSALAVYPLAGYVEVYDSAVVSSGGYERYFRHRDHIYYHIIDPSTGEPAETDLAGVTVTGPSAVEADALATAVFVMGRSAGLALLESLPGVEGLFIDAKAEFYQTSGMKGIFNGLNPAENASSSAS